LVCSASWAARRKSYDEELGICRGQREWPDAPIERETREHLEVCSGNDLRILSLVQGPILLEKKYVLGKYPDPGKPNKNLQHSTESDDSSFLCINHDVLVDDARYYYPAELACFRCS